MAALDASAQQAPACRPRGELVAMLGKKYAEAPAAAGITSKGALLEVIRARDGATWSVIITVEPGGPSCLVAEGVDWRRFTWRLEDPGT